MASIIRQDTGHGIRYMIQLSPGENEARPKISLGKVSAKQAQTGGGNIENLLAAKNSGGTLSPATQEWLSGISDGLRKRLTVLGLIEPAAKGRSYTVTEWAERYIESRADVKALTKTRWENAAGKLTAFFREDFIDDVSVAKAKAFRVYLKANCELSENTLRRLIGISRQFFNAAIDAGHITKNPFRGQSVAVRNNPARAFYVTPEMAAKVLDACPDTQWRLIFGLARWGGLRCPSEILRLTWQDVDFEHSRFTVHASKTEHHADSGIRTAPMFPELRPLFQDAFDEAKEGDVFCITRYRDTSANLRTQLHRIIGRAGLDVWPKLFQNLRSTRETELFKVTGGNVKAVCSWIGNSPAVAMQHYAQVTEADFQEAAKTSLIGDAEKTVHFSVQTTAETTGKDSQEEKAEPALSPSDCDSKREFAACCETTQNAGDCARQDSNL